MSYMEVATSSASDDWPTSRVDFDRLDREFGPFELDVCASAENAKCARFYTAADDGLQQPWTGRCWMNPPYGRGIAEWMRKARESATDGALVVCLVPARPDTRWWRDSAAAASLVRLLPGRLRFGDGKYPAPFPVRCQLCQTWWFPARTDAKTCSDTCRQALRRSQIRRVSRDKSGAVR